MTPSDVRPAGSSRPSPKRRLTSRSCLLVVVRLAAGDLFFLLPFAPLPGADSAAAAAPASASLLPAAPPGAESAAVTSASLMLSRSPSVAASMHAAASPPAASPIAPRAAPPPPHAAAVDRAARAVGPTPLRPSRAARRRDGCRQLCDCVCVYCVWGNAGNAGDAGTRGVHLTSRVQEML